MKYHHVRKNGFLNIIILLVIAFIVLGYFGFDVRKIIDSEPVKHNLDFLFKIIDSVWSFISGMAGKLLGNSAGGAS
jgi:hypothetical protein